MNTQSVVTEITRTGITAVLLVGTLWLSAHVGTVLVTLAGFGGLTTGTAGRALFAVSGLAGLGVFYLGYVGYYAVRA